MKNRATKKQKLQPAPKPKAFIDSVPWYTHPKRTFKWYPAFNLSND